MAKSFHNIIAEGDIEVKHLGEDRTFTLPEWLTKAASILDDQDALVQWAVDHEIIGGLIHSGIQQEIIRLRAAARPVINSYNSYEKFKEAERKLAHPEEYHINERDMQISKRMTMDDLAQERIDSYVCKMVKKPGTTKKEVSKEDAIKKLVASGMSQEEIIAAITAASK